MFPHLQNTQHFKHFTGQKPPTRRCETKELRTECRQTVQPWFRNCPTHVNRNRYASCHALRDECRLRTEARGDRKTRLASDTATCNTSTKIPRIQTALPQKYHGFRRVRATVVFCYPQIWTPSAVATTCSHTHTLPAPLSLHRWQHSESMNTQSEALDTT